MANEQNLKMGGKAHRLTVEEASRGGRASGKKRRERKLMREIFEDMLKRKYTNAQGQEMDGATIMCMKQFQNALDGDIRAFIEIRNTVGEMPVQQLEVAQIQPEAYDRVRAMLEDE